MQLRPYQTEAIEAVRGAYANGDRATLMVLPTGCGKTVVFSEIVRRVVGRGGRALVLAHRGELLEQAQAKLAAFGVFGALEKAHHHATTEDVVIASVQTLRGRRLEKWGPDHFALIVVDEAHHAVATTYQAILERYAGARVLGVTATPDRGDGEALGEVFDSCAFRYEIRQAIAEGYLVPIKAKQVFIEGLDLSKVRNVAGDLNLGDLEEVYADHVEAVAEPYVELAGDRQGILFGVTVAHAHLLAEAINQRRPGSAVALDGKAKPEERAAVLRRFRAGKVQHLINCALFTEGFDAPEVGVVGIARPTKSRALYTQMVGRGTRLAEGKADCLVVDFVGNAGRHSLCCPADVLAGHDVEDPIADRARELMAGGVEDPEEALDKAREEWEAKASPQGAVLRWYADDVDPFLGEIPEVNARWAGDPATEAQLAALKRAGITKLPDVTKGQAAGILDRLAERRSKGLATYKQAKLLGTYEMGFAEASQAIDRLMLSKFGAARDKYPLRVRR